MSQRTWIKLEVHNVPHRLRSNQSLSPNEKQHTLQASPLFHQASLAWWKSFQMEWKEVERETKQQTYSHFLWLLTKSFGFVDLLVYFPTYSFVEIFLSIHSYIFSISRVCIIWIDIQCSCDGFHFEYLKFKSVKSTLGRLHFAGHFLCWCWRPGMLLVFTPHGGPTSPKHQEVSGKQNNHRLDR